MPLLYSTVPVRRTTNALAAELVYEDTSLTPQQTAPTKLDNCYQT
jgi:hypothetical protein